MACLVGDMGGRLDSGFTLGLSFWCTGWVVSAQLSQGTGCVLFPLRRGEKWTLLVSLFLMCSVGSVLFLVLGISREQGEPRSSEAPIRLEEADRGQSQ